MNHTNTFEARMVEQIWQIVKYRNMLEQQGRVVSIDEAALEWIDSYADLFPPLDPKPI